MRMSAGHIPPERGEYMLRAGLPNPPRAKPSIECLIIGASLHLRELVYGCGRSLATDSQDPCCSGCYHAV